MSGWLSRIDIQPSEYLHSDQLNYLGLDIRNWGGDVNGGGFRLTNVLLSGAISATFNPSPMTVTQTDAAAPATSFTRYSTAYTGDPPAPQPVARWTAGKSGDPETGSNAGSNYVINRYSDAGALLGTSPPLTINRATGVISMGQQLWLGPVNGNGQVLTNVSMPGILTDPTSAKGDMLVRDASALQRLGVGADGQVLMADSTQSLGVAWKANPGSVASVFGRTGAVVAATGDYTAAQITNAVSAVVAYADPSWITSLNWSKVTGAPAFVPNSVHVFAGTGMTGGGALTSDVTLNANVSSVFGRTGAVVLTPTDVTGAGGVSTSRQVLAGSGMSGGGALSADVTLNANVQTVFGRTGAIVLTTTDINNAGGVTQARKINTDGTLTGGGDLSVDRTLSVVSDSTIQRIRASQNGSLITTTTGGRREINFIGGTGITMTVSDNGANNRIDVAISAGGGASLPIDPTTTLGDLIVRGSSNLQRLGVGGDTLVLMADSTQPLGMKWATPPGNPQSPWVGNIDGAGWNLSNVGTITASGVIRSTTGGIGFPDGSTQLSAGVPTTRQVLAGAGMTGGGALSADITLNAAVLSVQGRTGAITLTAADIASAGGVPSTRQVLAGSGMSGGGALSADVTLNANVLSVFGRTGAVTLTSGDIVTAGGATDPTTTKGDLIVRGTSALARLGVGSNGQVLTADSTQTTGTKWATPAPPTAQTPWTSNIDGGGYALSNVLAIWSADFISSKAAATTHGYMLYSGASARWYMATDGTAEGSGNAGTNFAIYSYANDGSFIGTPFSIVRGTGICQCLYGLETRGPGGPPTASGTYEPNMSFRVSTSSGGNCIDMGAYNATPFGMWIQATDRNALNAAYPLLLNPNSGAGGGGVGIGSVTNPVGRLHVSGLGAYASSNWNCLTAVRISDGGQNNHSAITFDTGATGPTAFRGFFIWKNSQDFAVVRFDSGGAGNPTLDLFIGSNGRIGIGTQTPGYLLDVSGDVNTTGVYRVNGVPISTGGGGPTTVVRPARAFGTPYQNTGATARFVNVGIYFPTPATNSAQATCDATSNPTTGVANFYNTSQSGSGFTITATLSFIVLPGYWYKVTVSGGAGFAQQDWTEWN